MEIKFNKEVRIALLMILTVAFFIWGYAFLKGKNLFSPTNDYYALYERVGGLMESGHVMLNGYRVGYVDDIIFTADQRHLAVKMSVEKNIELPEGTIARIVSLDFMGTKAVDLVTGVSANRHLPGDTLISEIEPELVDGLLMQIEPIRHSAEKMMSSIDSVFSVVSSMLDENMQGNVSAGMENLAAASGSLRQSLDAMETLLTDDQSRFNNLMANLESLSSNAVSITDSLAGSDLFLAINNMNDVLDDLNRLVEKAAGGEGSLGKLLEDEELYNNLESATRNLDLLLIDLRERPGRYVNFSVFGRRRN